MADANNDISGPNGVDDVYVEIGDPKRVSASIKEKLEHISPSSRRPMCCIYKVHEKLRKINEHAFTPAAVAIGPYHHDDQHLQPMEEYKLRYVDAILTRTQKNLEDFVEAVWEILESARECYSEPIKYSDNKFMEMLLVDGLFIIGLMCRDVLEMRDRENGLIENAWMMDTIKHDLILLENQLPMSVLQTILDLTLVSRQGTDFLTILALFFFNPLRHMNNEILEMYYSCGGLHLLNLLSKTFDSSDPLTPSNFGLMPLPCATELQQSGIEFREDGTGRILDIKFNNGVLEIPPLYIDDRTESFLRNLIALEQHSFARHTYITSYAFFMDSLINSANDVALLRRKKIIINYLGSDEAVSTLFNDLCNGIFPDNYHFSDTCESINTYHNTRRNHWKATFKRNYFSSPWKFLSVVVAALLLIFTFTGTLFAILSFFVHGS